MSSVPLLNYWFNFFDWLLIGRRFVCLLLTRLDPPFLPSQSLLSLLSTTDRSNEKKEKRKKTDRLLIVFRTNANECAAFGLASGRICIQLRPIVINKSRKRFFYQCRQWFFAQNPLFNVTICSSHKQADDDGEEEKVSAAPKHDWRWFATTVTSITDTTNSTNITKNKQQPHHHQRYLTGREWAQGQTGRLI